MTRGRRTLHPGTCPACRAQFDDLPSHTPRCRVLADICGPARPRRRKFATPGQRTCIECGTPAYPGGSLCLPHKRAYAAAWARKAWARKRAAKA